MSFLATTSGVSGEDVRDLMLAAVEHRFGLVNRLPVTIEWLSDNGSCYVADETRRFARDIGLEPRTTPIESPQSMEWPKPSSVQSNVTMSASVRARMLRPSCTSSQLGLITTTRFTPTRLSDIVHPVSLSQLAEARDVTMSASVRARMLRPSCTSSQLGLITTTRFTPTRLSNIVHPVSSSQLTEARDRVRSFGGYNRSCYLVKCIRLSYSVLTLRQRC